MIQTKNFLTSLLLNPERLLPHSSPEAARGREAELAAGFAALAAHNRPSRLAPVSLEELVSQERAVATDLLTQTPKATQGQPLTAKTENVQDANDDPSLNDGQPPLVDIRAAVAEAYGDAPSTREGLHEAA